MDLDQIKERLHKMAPVFAKRLAPIYQLLDWKWSPGNTVPHIPSVGEIEHEFHDLIDRLEGGPIAGSDAVGTGGIEAYYNHPEEESGEAGNYGLSFTLDVEEFFN